MNQTKEQKNAHSAYQRVLKHQGKAHAERYGIQAHKLPLLLRSAGLVAALEYLDTRKTKAGAKELLEDLDEHAREFGLLGSKEKLKEVAMKVNLSQYLLLYRELNQIATWYKRFSVSVLDVEQGSDQEG